MATGFVQRFKGKIEADSLWVKGVQVAGAGAAANVSLISSSLGASTLSGSISVLLSSGSTTQAIVRLSRPFAGATKTIQVSTGLGVIITASTNGSITFNGSTLSVAASSGSTCYTLELVGTSTVNWAVVGAYPGIYTSTGGVIWTLSTSS